MAGTFKNDMLKVIEGGVGGKLILDFSLVGFIDSSGLGALVSVLKAMNGNGGIAIAGANSTVMGLLKLTRMDRVFATYANIDAAIAG
jgi:anti-sigma B factor antagonist